MTEMLNLMKNLIELFQITSSKNVDYEKGLWGELFTIYYLINKFKVDISSYWHNDFYLKYDFYYLINVLSSCFPACAL